MLGTHYLPQLYVTICHVISCDCKSVMVGHMRIQFYQLQLVMRRVVEQNLHLSSIYIYIYIFFFPIVDGWWWWWWWLCEWLWLWLMVEVVVVGVINDFLAMRYIILL